MDTRPLTLRTYTLITPALKKSPEFLSICNPLGKIDTPFVHPCGSILLTMSATSWVVCEGKLHRHMLVWVISLSIVLLRLTSLGGNAIVITIVILLDRYIDRLGWTNHTLVPWRQEFRYLTRNKCMAWFAQIYIDHGASQDQMDDSWSVCQAHCSYHFCPFWVAPVKQFASELILESPPLNSMALRTWSGTKDSRKFKFLDRESWHSSRSPMKMTYNKGESRILNGFTWQYT